MILALDFGTAFVKAILIDEDLGDSKVFSFNLGFKNPNISEDTIFSLIKEVQKLSDRKLISATKILAKVYISVSLPLSGAPNLTNVSIFSTGQALSSLDFNVLDLGVQFLYFKDRISISEVEVEKVLNWLPFKADTTDVKNYIENKKIYSSVVPGSPRDLFFEQAISRVRIKEFFRSQKIPVDFSDIYVTGGVFSKAPFLEQAVLIILDALEPLKPLNIWLDRNQVLTASALLKLNSIKEYSMLGGDFAPLFLGTALSLTESSEIKIDTGFKDGQKLSLKSGGLYVFPLKGGEGARLEVRSKGSRKVSSYSVKGGEVGLIIDLRGRPLVVPESTVLRSELLRNWDKSMSASGQVERV